MDLEPEVYVKPPANPALQEIRTAETEADRVVQSALLTQSEVVNVPASDKYRNPPSTTQLAFFLLMAAVLVYFASR
jgi:hypothetical protein